MRKQICITRRLKKKFLGTIQARFLLEFSAAPTCTKVQRPVRCCLQIWLYICSFVFWWYDLFWGYVQPPSVLFWEFECWMNSELFPESPETRVDFTEGRPSAPTATASHYKSGRPLTTSRQLLCSGTIKTWYVPGCAFWFGDVTPSGVQRCHGCTKG